MFCLRQLLFDETDSLRVVSADNSPDEDGLLKRNEQRELNNINDRQINSILLSNNIARFHATAAGGSEFTAPQIKAQD